ncbi:hypothetical protein SKAU_G00366730 [Synaphobranchus kaupii]|uniref:Immunoglobulin V-set domain-containing protein n=1 Tax=Synaphobranchus kaupii TaxID=118154 RepID=A0A9Q1EF95_SYNKA|nr:hypothetical protein SKAU_G00366730 [Synaphobranchus kaupii]
MLLKPVDIIRKLFRIETWESHIVSNVSFHQRVRLNCTLPKSCVYNFPKRNLSLSDAGTYYCAVATCGEILFGNRTKLDFEGELI